MAHPQRSAAEVKSEWNRRRRRQKTCIWIVAAVVLLWLLGVLVPAGIAGKWEERSPPYFPLVMVGFMFLNMGLALWNRRCPACGKDPGGAFQPMWRITECKNCRAQLRD